MTSVGSLINGGCLDVLRRIGPDRAVPFHTPLTNITISNIGIAISNMLLGDKLRYLT